MILASLVSVHVLGSLWFAVGDTDGGWVIEEQLHQAVLGVLAAVISSFRVLFVLGLGGMAPKKVAQNCLGSQESREFGVHG